MGDEILSEKRPSRMRFETLVFERYGAFTDRVLELREGAHLHVVLGANEAGKTSALNAIGDLLFGFGKTTNFAFLHDQTTLRVGARLRLADGSGLFLRRRKGSKNTLLDADDKPLADDLLAGVLGSVTREVFVSEFGLTAEALRKGGQELLKAGGRLAETLAASSARLSMLANLRARLDAEADDLFGPRRAAGKEFYAALDQHQEAERHLREAIVTADALAAAEGARRGGRGRNANRSTKSTTGSGATSPAASAPCARRPNCAGWTVFARRSPASPICPTWTPRHWRRGATRMTRRPASKRNSPTSNSTRPKARRRSRR